MEGVKEVYAKKWRTIGLDGECNQIQLYLPELWEKDDLLKWKKYFDEAFSLIEYRKKNDYATYLKLHDRISMESASVRYLLIVLYGEEVYDSKELYNEKLRLYEDLKRFNMWSKAFYNFDAVKKNDLGLSD